MKFSSARSRAMCVRERERKSVYVELFKHNSYVYGPSILSREEANSVHEFVMVLCLMFMMRNIKPRESE